MLNYTRMNEVIIESDEEIAMSQSSENKKGELLADIQDERNISFE
jgi:hypothetical protein